MMNINLKKFLNTILATCLFFVFAAIFARSVSAAPSLYFDPANQTTKKNEEFKINLRINTDTKSAVGADATIVYLASDLTVKSVTNGGFFSHFSYAQSTGMLEIHAYFSAPFESEKGAGSVAEITFVTSKESGVGAVSMVCSGSGADTGIIDENLENVLDCGDIGNQLNLTYTTSGTTTTPPSSDTGTGGTPPTNICGGTCGSVYNCNTGLFCYNGFCRNPDCKEDLTCGCKATPTPAPTKKPTPKPTIRPNGATPTPQIVMLTEYTPPPPYIPEETALPETTVEPRKGIDTKTAGIVIGAIVLGIAGILLIVSRIKGGKPPKFTPPTGPGFNSPPSSPLSPPPSF